ncbi:MAG: RHS repeat-associated core domain-containing protein [Bacteroidota bacterium]
MSNEHPTFVDAYFDDVVMTLNPSVVVAMNDYYAGGATFLSFARDGTPNKRRYQGKEWNSDLGLDQYDFEWRQHDPFIWRTTTQDPHGERYPRLSSYSWAANNPVSIIDPDGRDITQTDDRFSFTGSSIQQAFVNLRNQYDAFLSKQRANDQRNKANASSSGSTAVSAGGGGATDPVGIGQPKPEIQNQQEVAKFFADPKDGYKYMWDNSFRKGEVWRENVGFLVEGGGLIVLPTEGPTYNHRIKNLPKYNGRDCTGKTQPLYWRKVSHPDLL